MNYESKEKIRTLAWRQENETMKQSADVLRGQGHCWLLHVTYRKMLFLLQSFDLEDHQRPTHTSKHTDDVRIGQELRRNPHHSASELKEMHRDHLRNVSIRCIEHRPKKDLKIPSRRTLYCLQNSLDSTYEEEASPICFKIIIFTEVLMTRKRSYGLMNPYFNASPETNIGHFSAIIDTCTLPKTTC